MWRHPETLRKLRTVAKMYIFNIATQMQAAWNTGSASDFKFNYKDGGQVKYSSLTPSLNMTECTGYSRKWLPSVKRLVFIHQDPSS